MEKLAVVILNYNGRQLLEKFLPSVIAYTPYQVIVADNHSTDDSVNFLAENFSEIRVISLPENYGFARGYNEALRQIKAEYYILLNSDIEVTPGWIDPMLALLDQNPVIAACQPKILAYHQKSKFEYAGAAGGFIDFLGFPFCRGRIFSTIEEDKGQYDDAIPVFWASGACLCIRSSVYHQLGGLDDDFFAHLEEIDLCWRILQDGLKIYCQPASVVYHVGGGTLSYGHPRKTYLNFRNSVAMLYKNTPTAALFWKMPLKLLLDWVASFKFLSAGGWGDFLAVYKAHFHFLKNFNKWRREKQKVKHKKVKEIYPKSIVVQYYLLGRNTFTKLSK
jgi:GT2 family glycosyltransferase